MKTDNFDGNTYECLIDYSGTNLLSGQIEDLKLVQGALTQVSCKILDSLPYLLGVQLPRPKSHSNLLRTYPAIGVLPIAMTSFKGTETYITVIPAQMLFFWFLSLIDMSICICGCKLVGESLECSNSPGYDIELNP